MLCVTSFIDLPYNRILLSCQCREHTSITLESIDSQYLMSAAPNTTPQSQPGQGFWWGGRPQQQTNPVPGSHAHPQHPHSRHPTEAELMNQFRNAAIKALNKRLTVSLEAHGSKIAAEAEELAENERKLHSRTAEIEKKV